MDGWMDGDSLFSSASSLGMKASSSLSLSAMITSCGWIVFLPAEAAYSFELIAKKVLAVFTRSCDMYISRTRGGFSLREIDNHGTYLEARKLTNTVALFDNASSASLCIDVLAGRTPLANREIMVRGNERSCVYR